MAGQSPNMDQFEAYFQRADVDRDGRVSGIEAVNFLQASNLPRQVLAQIWTFADQNRLGFLGRQEFYNALKLVTVAQSKKDLTPELVRAALYGPASSKIPPPQINLGLLGPQSNVKANPSPAVSASPPSALPGIGVSSQHALLTQPNQVTRPPQPLPPSSGFPSQSVVASHGMPGTGLISTSSSPNPLSSIGGGVGGSQPGISSQVSNRSLTPSATPGNFGQMPAPTTELKAPEITGPLQPVSSKPNDTGSLGDQVRKDDPKPHSATGNGFPSDSLFGDVFSATSSQPQQNSTGTAYPTGSVPASSVGNSVLSRDQPSVRPTGISQPPTTPAQQFPSAGKANQHVSAHKPPMFPAPAGQANQHVSAHRPPVFPAAAGHSVPPTAGQSKPPWPRMNHSDIQKYSKVFVQVDTDKDGRITGEQARNLFLSWKLPREILKQVWDLSDQDNDSMLSLREFCVALYLMERFREGRHLPTVLPHSFILDEALFAAPTQPTAAHGVPSWRPSGFQQPQGINNARAIPSAGAPRPPRPAPVPQPDEPIQQKAKVPELEKHLLDQLSTEEQDALNKKFDEAKEAEKKVAELEKDILEAKQKVQFYHAKMQELILYKSRCDNRLNEITERVVGDKKEAELLAKKYEEKYMQVGDVASKLTIEEATFRDIQEKKMELYRAIFKLDQENPDGVQDRANQVQSDLEELVKALNERCKTYGLRAKPTSLLELPFGWQPGIEGTAADWDEDWDKFEDEGFTFVKELTLDVQNVIAPPKPKSAFREKPSSFDGGKSPTKADGKKSELPSSGERATEDDRPDTNNGPEHTTRTPPDSPAGSNAAASPSKDFRDFRMRDFNINNGSPHAFDTQSEFGSESVFDKRFDEPSWGNFDPHYDGDAAWDSASVASKDGGSLFGPDDWGLNPIKTGSRGTDASLPKQGPFFDSVPSTPANLSLPKQGPFFDSVPSTPSNTSFQKQGPFFDSVPSTPLYNNSPHADNLFARNSQYAFADSVPTTPMYNFSSSPKKFNEGSEEPPQSFDSFSRFDSFNMQDSGPFGSRDSFSRFDSMRSTQDSTDFDQGYFAQPETLTRFDSFRSTADSDYNFGAAYPPQTSSFSRFDSMNSTRDTDYGHGFDDTVDPFGSGEPFKSSHEAQTPSRDSDSWKAF